MSLRLGHALEQVVRTRRVAGVELECRDVDRQQLGAWAVVGAGEDLGRLVDQHLAVWVARVKGEQAQAGQAHRDLAPVACRAPQRERLGEVGMPALKQYATDAAAAATPGIALDESDQLESGIDIIAQPPGKRLQSVQLLSGGEKALTAMALMFAIFKYRPSPFCLLDEIDAPLDDANIGRFVEMLQGMQEHTQFILITHNRKTMEIADRLYGVTMEEPGVSKLISVQLN